MGGQKSKQQSSTSTMDAAAITAVALNTTQPKQRRIQNYLLIWVDCNIDQKSQDCQNTLAHLHSVVNEVNLCTTPTQCIEILNDMDDEKAFVISSGALGQHLVSDIHGMTHVDAIYIFCRNKARHEQWAKEWPKIEGVFTEITSICESLKQVAHDCDHDAIPMSFVPKRIMADEAATAVSDQQHLDQLEPSFMYSVLFKEIVLEISEDDTKAVKDLSVYCRKKGILEAEIEDFQRKYHQRSPIWWYTREIFLYGMLNRALRSLDMEVMAKVGFFIRNLHRQLDQLHKKQSSTYKTQFIVYRGQGLTKEDFEHLIDTKGGLLSFNNFLSTSTKKQVAMKFVERVLHKYEDHVGVLFVMTIDPKRVLASTTPFALIDEYSAIPQEQEILFSMHTVFRVTETKQMFKNNRLWEVELTLTNDKDPQLAALIHRMREETQGSTGWYRMGHLMLIVGHFNQAEELYNELLKNSYTNTDKAYIYNQLGWVKDDQGLYKEAASFYEKSLEINRESLSQDHSSLASTYSNIGQVYNKMSHYSKALEFYKKALEIYGKSQHPDYPALATSCSSIGQVYKNMGDYAKALHFHRKAHQIFEKFLPPNHPNLATSYSNIGQVYSHMDDYSKALEFYEKDLEITKKALPSNHPDFATSCSNIGQVYKNMGNYSKALEFYEEAHKIFEKVLPPNHPNLATSYSNIGQVYNDMGDYSKALEFYEEAHKIFEKALTPNHPSLVTSLSNIGSVYCNIGDHSKGVEFLEKALAILQKTLPPTHPLIKRTIDNIKCVTKEAIGLFSVCSTNSF
ncbi:unnamed protein product [Rotaria sp. Silwood1]|nr:unnamed protein product [Rotaria sp. Silwood1]